MLHSEYPPESSQAPSDVFLREVYDELRHLARYRLRQETPGQTVQATALVHEAYLRMRSRDGSAPKWENREHFFNAAALAMCHILTDRARKKKCTKHGGDRVRIELTDAISVADGAPEEFLALAEALHKLELAFPERAKLVRLRFFAGLSHQDAADVLDISRSTADRYWKFSKAFLWSETNNSM